MTDDRLVRTDLARDDMPDSMRLVMNAQSLRAQMPDSGSWTERALQGFLESGIHAVSNPGETAVKVGSGLAIGAAIQTGLNNAELAGGKVGAIARVAKTAAVAIPAVLTVTEIASADDPANAAGRMAFEMGLFLGTAKAGTYADRIPGAGRFFGPRPASPVPEGLSFQVVGKNVRVSTSHDYYGPSQVRLTNGKGFVADRWDKTVPLIDMPKTAGGRAHLEYEPHATTLVAGNNRFSRSVDGRSTSTTRDGKEYSLGEEGSLRVMRTVDGAREQLTIFPDGRKSVMQGSYQSGRSWEFAADGSVSMRSLPAGKYRMSFGPDGEGIYKYTHGTSRGIMGLAGPRSRHAPLKIDERPMNIKDAGAPDVTVDPQIGKDLATAREVFRGLLR